MTIILVIVFIIMVLLNGALFYVLKSSVSVTEKQVKNLFAKELENYSDFLDGKREEAKDIKAERDELYKEIAEMKAFKAANKTVAASATNQPAAAPFVPTARYIDDNFFDAHKNVNEMMSVVDKAETIRQVREKLSYTGDREAYKASSELLKLLSGETLYNLCTLTPSVQKDVIIDSVAEGKMEQEAKLLTEFLSSHENDSFDILQLIAYLKSVKACNDPNIYVRTGQKSDKELLDQIDCVVQYDEDISEGMKIIFGDKVFDFSICRARRK